jgi:hypothetical protein
MGDLGTREAMGATGVQTNPFGSTCWTVSFTPGVLNIPLPSFEVYHMAIRGPSGSQFQIYLDTTFYSNVVRGDVNDWDPSQPMHVGSGRTIYFYWNTGTGSAPTATIYCRESSPL